MRTNVPEKLLKIVEEIDTRGDANLTRLVAAPSDRLAKAKAALVGLARGRVVREETRKILDEDHFSTSSAAFLIELGLVDEAASYLLRRAGQLNGGLYDSLLPLAEALERHGHALAATAVYRALLDSILRRAQYKAYHHGADYLRKLDALAGAVEDWQAIQPHAAYAQALAKAHGRKSGFWGHYRAGG